MEHLLSLLMVGAMREGMVVTIPMVGQIEPMKRRRKLKSPKKEKKMTISKSLKSLLSKQEQQLMLKYQKKTLF